MKKEYIFETLLLVVRELEKANIFYILSSGTLLGSIRDGVMVDNEYDFDIEVKSEDENKILALNENLFIHDIFLEKEIFNPIDIKNKEVSENIFADRRLIRVKRGGETIGDIFLFTCFSDGVLRRFDTKTNTYINPRHQTPAWFWEARVQCELHGEKFWAPRYPEVILESMYGKTWIKPIKPYEHGPGRQKTGGAIIRRKTQGMIIFALMKGWDNNYSSCNPWPARVDYTISKRAIDFLCWTEPECLISIQKNPFYDQVNNPILPNIFNSFPQNKIADVKGMLGSQFSSECNEIILKLPTAEEYRKEVRQNKQKIKFLEKENKKQRENITRKDKKIISLEKEKIKFLKELKKLMIRWETFKNKPVQFLLKVLWKRIVKKFKN